MIKEELEKATGQELIDERDYCGVDGYYGVYLDNVNAEMLKRFNRLAELEARCNELFLQTCEQAEKIGELEKENARLKDGIALKDEEVGCVETDFNTFKSKAKDHIKKLLDCLKQDTNDPQTNYYVCQYMDKAEQFLSEVEK